jgi:hypothetical protein
MAKFEAERMRIEKEYEEDQRGQAPAAVVSRIERLN